VLEEQLMTAFSRNLTTPELHEHLLAQFHAQTVKAWKDRSEKSKREASSTGSLREKRKTLQKQAENVIDAIAATKGSTLLYDRLGSIEGQIRSIDILISSQKQKRGARPSADEINGFLERKLSGLESLIGGNPDLAKQLVLERVGRLVMVPTDMSNHPTYEVKGDVRLFLNSDPGAKAKRRLSLGREPRCLGGTEAA
jgi:hypothetical protein